MPSREVCPKCGAIYDVEMKQIFLNDSDTYRCEGCQEVLRVSNGPWEYIYRLVQPGKPQKSSP